MLRLFRRTATTCGSGQRLARRCFATGVQKTVPVTFLNSDKKGASVTVDATVGETLMEVAWANQISLEGACDQAMACSTCHVIVDDAKRFQAMDPPVEDELDMLDLAPEVCDQSRLACQVVVDASMSGLVVRVPQVHTSMLEE